MSGAVQALAPLAEAKKVSLQVDLPAADIRIEADLELLKQLVLHLGGNAVKFTAPGGTVRISGGGDGEHGVLLRVEDTGIGISEDQLERIFERFYQVDQSLVRRFGGTGLGLALAKSIVQIHGGAIEVQSTPGDGSVFLVRLPRTAPVHASEMAAGGMADPGSDAGTGAGDALRLTRDVAGEALGVESDAVARAGGSERVRLARVLARSLALTECEVGWVAWAALVGGSEGTEAEGADGTAAAAADRPPPVREILAQRCERVDGSGKPQGLMGDEIVIGARILSVTDAFASRVAGRDGAPGTDPVEVVAELRRESGREFDPAVVEALVAL